MGFVGGGGLLLIMMMTLILILWCRVDLFESVVNKFGMGYKYRNGQEKNRLIYARWFLTLATGVITALVAVFLLYFTTLLTSIKHHLIESRSATR